MVTRKKISISKEKISFHGRLSCGPGYNSYLTKTFVTGEEGFLKKKNKSLRIGATNSFDECLPELSGELNIERYNSTVIWCGSFSKFITVTQNKN